MSIGGLRLGPKLESAHESIQLYRPISQRTVLPNPFRQLAQAKRRRLQTLPVPGALLVNRQINVSVQKMPLSHDSAQVAEMGSAGLFVG
ncbi:MAG: hypothetical protein AAF998_11665, partial [Bacteroidota bacterium]